MALGLELIHKSTDSVCKQTRETNYVVICICVF